jgi:hypothetical protein
MMPYHARVPTAVLDTIFKEWWKLCGIEENDPRDQAGRPTKLIL